MSTCVDRLYQLICCIVNKVVSELSLPSASIEVGSLPGTRVGINLNSGSITVPKMVLERICTRAESCKNNPLYCLSILEAVIDVACRCVLLSSLYETEKELFTALPKLASFLLRLEGTLPTVGEKELYNLTASAIFYTTYLMEIPLKASYAVTNKIYSIVTPRLKNLDMVAYRLVQYLTRGVPEMGIVCEEVADVILSLGVVNIVREVMKLANREITLGEKTLLSILSKLRNRLESRGFHESAVELGKILGQA